MFQRQKLYTVHLNPDAPEPYETLRLIPESFSIGAFVFNGLWLIYHRVWLWGVMFLAIIVALGGASVAMPEHAPSFAVLRMVVSWYIGLQGYDMVRAALKRQGYLLVDVVAANSLIEAQQRFLDRRLPQTLPSSPPPSSFPSMGTHGSRGLVGQGAWTPARARV
jgi:hypothetical protein